MAPFKDKILNLIDQKREGEYWDFKEKYHDNNAKLIHDILCLSNIPSRNDSYIIFGVSDSGEIKGVSNDKGRKTQAMVVDMLRNANFAGDKVPFIKIETLEIDSKEVDILVIENSNNTPYYLEKPYNKGKTNIPAGTIYTRNQDSNTPIDRVANQQVVEYLWKKRFGIDLSPFDRLLTYIADRNGWQENSVGKYYKNFPEFVFVEIEESEDRKRDVYYAHNMMNSSHYFKSYQFKYHQTILYENEMVVLDSARYITSAPKWEILPIEKHLNIGIPYNYYIKGSTEWLIHNFFLDSNNQEEEIARRRLLEVILVFESDEEKHSFDEYIVTHVISSAENEIQKTDELKVAKFLKGKLEEYRGAPSIGNCLID